MANRKLRIQLDMLELPAEPPTEVCLFKSGLNRTSKGNFIFDSLSAESVLTLFKDHGMDKLPVDYGHAMVSWSSGCDGKAAGWFIPEIRDGALWATQIEWTKSAFNSITEREWRFFSPAIYYDYEEMELQDESGTKVYGYRVLELINFALTNLPATKDQLPLVASQSEENTMSDQFLKLLDCKDVPSALVALNMLIERDKATSGEYKQLLHSLKASNLVEALTNVAKVHAELDKVRDEQLTSQKKELIRTLSKDGKLQPAMHDWALKQSLSSLQELSQITVSQTVLTTRVEETVKNTTVLTAEEIQIANQMKVPLEKMQAFKNKQSK